MPVSINDPLKKLVNDLNQALGAEGFAITIGEQEMRQGGFQRVYVNKGLPFDSANLFLDLRIGPETPAGYSIEMATAKPGTYGIPGFARHISGERDIRSTTDTFADYVRSVYDYAAHKRRTPQQSAWSVYQEGWAGRQYPQSGATITPGASSGKRAFSARTIRYFLQPDEQLEDYVQRTRGLLEAAPTQGFTGIHRMAGYGIETREHKAWIPLGTRAYIRPDALGVPETLVGTAMDPQKAIKSLTTVHGARETADVPFYQTTAGLRALPISEPASGLGLRYGYTRSSMVMPGELEPRRVLTQVAAFGEQPDLPGAAYSSPSAFQVRHGDEKYEIYAMGEKAGVQYRFGVGNYQQLKELVNKDLQFYDIEGKLETAGPNKFSIGRWFEGDEKNRQARQILIDRKPYDIRLGKPTLHVPRYWDPTTAEGRFSNLPGAGFETTDAQVEALRQKFGHMINISHMSAVGSGMKDDAAEVYVTAPIHRLGSFSMKGATGTKAYPVETPHDMQLELFGVEGGPEQIDTYTAEGKIPTRALMGNFGIMNMQTQLAFLDEFLAPKSSAGRTGLSAIKNYIRRQYEGGQPAISADVMGDIWSRATGSMVTGDSLFARMMNNVLNVTDKEQAKRMWRVYGIGLPTEQDFSPMQYSKGQMNEMRRLMKDIPGADNLITSERLKRQDPVTKMVRAMTGDPEGGARELHNMAFKVPGRGGSVVFTLGEGYVTEYPFREGYVNPKGISNLMTMFPEASREMAIMGELPTGLGWLGPTEPRMGGVKPSAKGWTDLYFWMGYQNDLNSGRIAYPMDAVQITPSLAGELNEAIVSAKSEPTSMAQLMKLKERMKNISALDVNAEEGTRFHESMLFDRNSMTLIPKLSSIMDVESYGEGVNQGETVTYMGDNYIRMLEAAVSSARAEPGAEWANIADARRRFHRRVENSFFPEGRRAKEMFKNLTGAYLPGAKGGRYQGLTQLEVGEAYASDDYIRRILASGGFKDTKQIESIMQYLNKVPGAYLPILTQRFPDISGKYTFMPMKLRSRRAFEDMGVSVPKGPTSRDVFYMSTVANRFFVGDFDADPAMQKILPIDDYDFASGSHTGVWKMNPAVQKEFDQSFKLYSDVGHSIDTALQGMFGSMGTTGNKTLDVSREALMEYVNVMSGGEYNLVKRVAAAGNLEYSKLLDASMEVMNWDRGMSASYIRRTKQFEIADAIHRFRDPEISSRAYEGGAMAYQMYLDRMSEASGGLTPMETMLNSFGIYNVTKTPQGGTAYNVGFFKSLQDAENIKKKAGFVTVSTQGPAQNISMLNNILSNIGDMPDWKETNVMLAYGFANTGYEQRVENVLNDPESYMRKRGYDPGQITRSRVLKQLAKDGAVGFNSPYYTTLAYEAVKRFSKQYPSFMTDPNVKIPWMGNKAMPVGEIAKTMEYKQMDVLNRLFLGHEPVGATEMDLIKDLGANRIGMLARGIHEAWRMSTGKLGDASVASDEFIENMAYVREKTMAGMAKATPSIRASEFGVLSNQADPRHWSARFDAVLRSLGAGEVMSDTWGQGALFTQVQSRARDEAIVGGINFEDAYKRKTDLTLVGSVDEDYILDYQVGGLRVRGIPDFIGFDEAANKFVIKDTKSPRKKDNVAYSEEYARRKASTHNYRMQQIAYAYGLEQKAKEWSPDKWISFMEGWGITDADKAARMQTAASQGRFSLSIQPGRVTSAGITDFQEIDIPYTAGVRAEFEGLAGAISKHVFAPEERGIVAASTWAAMRKPGLVPPELGGFYTRSRITPDPKMFGFLETFAKSVGRLAGGGRFEGVEGSRIRVGEGGPETIELDKNGVTVIPDTGFRISKTEDGLQFDDLGLAGGGRFKGVLGEVLGEFGLRVGKQSKGITKMFGIKDVRVVDPKNLPEGWEKEKIGEWQKSKGRISITEIDIPHEFGVATKARKAGHLGKEETVRDAAKKTIRAIIAHELGHAVYDRGIDQLVAGETHKGGPVWLSSAFDKIAYNFPGKYIGEKSLRRAYGDEWQDYEATELAAMSFQRIHEFSPINPARTWGGYTFGKEGYIEFPDKGLVDELNKMYQKRWKTDASIFSYKPKRIRVGEGGPEEVIVGKNEVAIVPTSELAESRWARGEDISREGYMGERAMGGRLLTVPGDTESDEMGKRLPEGEAFAYTRVGGDAPRPQPETPVQSTVQAPAPEAGIGRSEDIRALNSAMSLLNQNLGRLTDEGVPMKFTGGGGAAMNPAHMYTELGKALTTMNVAVPQVEQFQRGVSDVMVSTFERLGYTDVARQYQGGVNALDALSEANRLGISPQAYVPELRARGLMDQAQQMVAVGRAAKTVHGLQAKYGEEMVEQGFAFSPAMIEGQQRLELLTDEEIDLYTQGVGAGGYLWSSRTQPGFKKGKLEGTTIETFRELSKATRELTDAQREYHKKVDEGTATKEDEIRVSKLALRRKGLEYRAERETIMPQMGMMLRDGRLVGDQELEALYDQGLIGSAELQAAGRVSTLAEQERGAFRRMGDLGQGRTAGQQFRYLGQMARRMLGGFGLMYLGSIGRIAMGPAMAGYGEQLEQQQLAEQAFGQRFPGVIPSMTAERRIAIQTQLMGGTGWGALRGAQAMAMERAPGLGFLAGMGQAGVGAAGLSMWIASMAGAPAAPIGAAVGLGAAGIAGVGMIGGALAQPETTAIQVAEMARQGRIGGPSTQSLFQHMANMNPAVAAAYLEFGATQTQLGQRITGAIERYTGIPVPQPEILRNTQQLLEMDEWQGRRGQGERFEDWLVGGPVANLGRGRYNRLMNMYAQELGTRYSLDPKATYAALATQEQYGLALGMETGGTFELLASQIASGVDLEGLGMAAAQAMPGLGFGAQAARTGELVQQWLGQGGLGMLDVARKQTGIQRMAGLGIMAPDLPATEADRFIEFMAGMGTEQYGLYAGRVGQEARRRAMGMEYKSALELTSEYAQMTPEQRIEDTRLQKYLNTINTALENIESTFMTVADVLPDMSMLEGMGGAQLSLVQRGGQFGAQLAPQLIAGGMGGAAAGQFGAFFGWLGANAPDQMNMYMGMMGGDRRAFADLARRDPSLARRIAGQTFTGTGGTQISGEDFFLVDTDPETGLPTGHRYGTTSLATPIASSAQMAAKIFGDPSTWAAQGFDVGGIQALQAGGMRGMQDLMMDLQFGNQMAMFGIQRQQIQLQEWYMPQQFRLQDQYRQLGYAQTEWGFQMQERQLAEQQRYFGVTTGLQQRGMAMQREFTRGDWEYQDQVRGLQWQWQQEDFAESIRFQTGRQRRLSERGMRRATIMHDLEEEQIEKKRNQQEQLWDLEDERFEANIEHQRILFELQEENIAKQREFFEERKRLDAEMAQLQREYWRRQIELQKQSLNIQEAYARRMHALQRTMNELNRYIDDADAALSTFGATTMAQLANILREVNPLFQQFLKDFEEWKKMMDEEEGERLGGEQEQHFGGRVLAGETYSVLAGELFKPDMSGEIINPNLAWDNTTIAGDTTGTGTPSVNLTIYIGDEHIADRVIDLVDAAIEV